MSEQLQPRRGMFESLWPWPGVILLVLLAAWFFYMGSMAAVDDISTAFLGLGGVTSLLALLGLRAANLGGMRAIRTRDREPVDDLDDDDDFDDDEEEMLPVPQRTAIASEVEEPKGAIGANEPIPLHPPVREESAKEKRAARRREKALAAESASVSDDMPRSFKDVSEIAAAIEHLEVMINREKAERGAALARLGAGAPSGGGGGGEGGEGDGREFSVALEERLNKFLTIPAFNAAMNQKVFPQINTMMRKALQEQIGPEALKERMTVVAEDGEDAETSMTLALQLAEARQALEAHIEEVQKDRNALREELRAVRESSDQALRQIAERGAAASGEGDAAGAREPDDGALAARVEEIARSTGERIDKVYAALERLEQVVVALRAADATGSGEAGSDTAAGQEARNVVALVRGELEEVRTAMDRKFAEVGAKLEEMSTAGQKTSTRVEVAETVNRQLARKVEGIVAAQQEAEKAAKSAAAAAETAAAAASAPAPAALAEAPPADTSRAGDVDALRDALTTIIEQNRAIRAQQEMLSARFNAPAEPAAPAPPAPPGDTTTADTAAEPSEKG